MGQLELAVREATAGQSGTLTIGAISSALVDAIPPLVEQLKHAHPDISIAVREIDSAEAVTALQAGELDLAFARLQGELGSEISTKLLGRDRLAVAMPLTHRLAASRTVRLGQLVDEPFVMFMRRVSPVYFDSIIAGCQEHGFSPRVLHDVRSVAAQVALVGCGQGVALIPAGLKRLAPANVLVKPLKEAIEVVTTAVAWRRSSINPALKLALSTWRWA
jgi:DNA-binding transcriptional LysR family regulator